MTFSQRVKEELLLLDIDPNTAKVELMAAFKAIGVIQYDYSGIQVELKTSQIKLTKRLLEIIKTEYPRASVQTVVRQSRRFKKDVKVYILRISSHVREILFDLKFIDLIDQSFIFDLVDVSHDLLKEDEKKVYARTFFCCSGSVNDPAKASQYHLEITSANLEYLQGLQKLVKYVDINMKISKRKNSYALYINRGEEIEDFLKFIMSYDMLFVFADFRLTRDIHLENNRLNNAEIANEMKRLSTSNKQIGAIELLKENGLYDTLKDKTKLVCELRLNNPEDSLNELSIHSNETISKSNIRHHLNIVTKLADLIKE